MMRSPACVSAVMHMNGSHREEGARERERERERGGPAGIRSTWRRGQPGENVKSADSLVSYDPNDTYRLFSKS